MVPVFQVCVCSCISVVLLLSGVAGYRECDVSSNNTNCHLSEGYSSEQMNIEAEFRDMIEKNMCLTENDTNLSLVGSCGVNGSGSHIPATLKTLRGIPCFCDSLCHLYRDCCIDKVNSSLSAEPSRWTCRDVSQTDSPVPVYVIQNCPADYASDKIRSFCEEEAVDLFAKGMDHNYLQKIPVHSASSGLMYRNVYCAMCNDEMNLTMWKSHMHCLSENKNFSIESVVSDFSTKAKYDPYLNQWTVYQGKDIAYCGLIVEELTSPGVLDNYARYCTESVSSCSPSATLEMIHRCQSYTSYVYDKYKGTVYKNFHCALCNKVPAHAVICFEESSDGRRFMVHRHYGKVWLPVLFDFNFDGDPNNQVGVSHTCLLKDGQVWDPLLKVCLNITCGRLFQEVDGTCVPIEDGENLTTSGLQSNCRKIILHSDLFVLLDNGSVYVNHSGKVYSVDQFEVHEETDGIVTALLICESDDPFFEFDAVQVWLSEITLGLSIACLILHLLAYGSLPKFRNRPGKVLMSLSSTLICGHLFLLLGPYFRKSGWLCYLSSVLTYFGYLTSFFWMNVMSFDIYRTFSASQTHGVGRKTFVTYSLYVWPSSAFLVAIACVVDLSTPESSFTPSFGQGVCWFNHKLGLFIFFAVPLAVILLANITFFSMTAVNIRTIAKQAKSVSNFTDQKRFFLYVKLAVVMGLTWITGFVAGSTRISALWYPFIILNGLQGVLIFAVFTIKRKIIHLLVVKLRLRSDTYSIEKGKMVRKGFYNSLSTLTTLQTSLTSTIVPVASGSPDMLKAVRKLSALDESSQL